MAVAYSTFTSCSSPIPLPSPTLVKSSSVLSAHSLAVSSSSVQQVWKQPVDGNNHLGLVLPSPWGFCERFYLSVIRDTGSTLRWKAMADPSTEGPPVQDFTFANKDGLKLKGLLVDGGAGSKEICILCHGFRSSKHGRTMSALSTGLVEAGVSTFRFDFSGHGDSEGTFAFGNYWKEVEDLRAAVEFWASRGSRVVCVAGHSKGGICVVLYASKYHDVPCVINISGRFALEKGILERFGGQEALRKLEDEGVLDIKDASGNVEYQVTKADLRDRLTTNMHAACLAIPEATRVLTIHGTDDEVIPADDAYQFAQRIPTHKLVLIKDANHGFQAHQSQLTKHVLQFLEETRALQESG